MSVGQSLTFLCRHYIYYGVVTAECQEYWTLDPCWIVYDTGAWKDKEWKIAERILTPWNVQKSAVESWGAGKAPYPVVGITASPARTADLYLE